MSYDRMITERPRHFIVVGTTNSSAYLKDSTGNRRFWPVRIGKFKTKQLLHDRDQLWAEAAHYEKEGMSIRLDEKLWGVAEIQQERRRIEDPWELRITATLGDIQGRIVTDDVWKIVGMFDVSRRNQNDNVRIGDAMRRMGFDRTSIRINEKIKHGYVRGTTEDEKKQLIVISMDDDQEPFASVKSTRTAMEWEKPSTSEKKTE